MVLLYKAIRKVVVFIVGVTVILFGVLLILTPGPAIVVIPAGLAILATEFPWAKRMLNPILRFMNRVIEILRRYWQSLRS